MMYDVWFWDKWMRQWRKAYYGPFDAQTTARGRAAYKSVGLASAQVRVA
jgi:hypothetical protein